MVSRKPTNCVYNRGAGDFVFVPLMFLAKSDVFVYTVEELVCLGAWKEGSNHYLVGKVDHIHANSDEDRYRCFIYERPHHQGNTQTWNLAQSADATCQGLISAHEGSKTMKLTKGNMSLP